MNMTLYPSALAGMVPAVSSKSMAHRLLILSALSKTPSELVCTTTSEDIEATRRCMDTLCAIDDGTDGPRTLDCGESGSTLRFLLPIIGALGVPTRIIRRGRLASRPLAPFDEQLCAHGMRITEDSDDLLVEGQLNGGRFSLPGNVSSQFVSGLLMAAPLLSDRIEVFVSTPVQSRPYITMTITALAQFGVEVTCDRVGIGPATCERFALEPIDLMGPAHVEVEGDWSNASFWLAAGALEDQGLTVSGLDLMSVQGDRAILAALAALGARIARQGTAARCTRDVPRSASLDVGSIPDLVPPLAAVMATTPGTSRLRNAGRLRLKESDRLATVSAAINALGGQAYIEGDDLIIVGTEQLAGGEVDAANDHRIAMMAAILATHAAGPTTVCGADCVAKSYPGFWDDYRLLGGKASQAPTHVTEQPQA